MLQLTELEREELNFGITTILKMVSDNPTLIVNIKREVCKTYANCNLDCHECPFESILKFKRFIHKHLLLFKRG